MFPMKSLLAASMMTLVAVPAFAEIEVKDAYARASSMMSKSGAAFMVIANTGEEDDRLVSANSDIAARVELHTHKIDDNGIAKMVEVEEGFVIPAGGEHALARGGDHVMFMGLNGAMEQDQIVTVTLTFEQAGDVVVEIPVDLTRKPKMMGHGQHGDNGMKKMGH